MRKVSIGMLMVSALLLSACSASPTAQGVKDAVPAPNDVVTKDNAGMLPVTADPQAGDQTKLPPSGDKLGDQTKLPPPGDKTGGEPPKTVKREIPKEVRGIQVSGWIAGTTETIENLVVWGKGAGINAVVLDLKAEDGKISWMSHIPLAAEIGSNEAKIAELPSKIELFHHHGMWVIGRIVVMNDQYLYQGRPASGIPGFTGGPYSFIDPKSPMTKEYNLAIAKEAIAAGVDEIQFDYIRYPEKLVSGYNGKDTTAEQRTAPINDFLKYMVSELKPLGVPVSADVFGLTTSVNDGDDMEIGQDYKQIAEIVDFISPMVYPSHYAPGTYGLDNPNANPYETVKRSMEKALERTKGLPGGKHRPWIQDFTMGHPYGKAEVEAQVRALSEVGIKSYLLWDPNCKFTRSAEHHGQ